MLTITTLGQFDVVLDGMSLHEGVDIKRGLLLAYLWEQRNPLPRLQVARMLWPWVDDSTAQVNLRSLLLRMRREGLDRFIIAGRSTVALTNRNEIDYDVAQIRELTANVTKSSLSDLTRVADLYQGAFLQSAALDDYPYLDEWASGMRAEMEIRAMQAISTLVAEAISLGHAEMILGYAEQLVGLAPYDDSSQELYMRALASAGRVSDALNHFYQYQRRLKDEMQIDQVGRNLLDLVAELRQPRLDTSLTRLPRVQTLGENVLTAENEGSTAIRFPHIEHPIVGRHLETKLLLEYLDNGNRLLTVAGIGGTGKTFFIRSQYDNLSTRFQQAIYYVDLRSHTVSRQQAGETLLFGIVSALNLTPAPEKPFIEQVTFALQRRKCCLILDNFETVRNAADRLIDLLKALPQLTIIITSRERLGLPTESVLALNGLRLTPNEPDEEATIRSGGSSSQRGDAIDSDAVRYFLQCVRRFDTDFTINDENRPWIETICREVDGLPLAIELTAMQAPFYSLPELAQRIHTDPSVLVSEVTDLPGDHHSIWAVLDSMLQTLEADERRVLIELSVFAGVFSRDAMMTVAPASRQVYVGLINASLLRVDEPGWFSLHPLVRQHAGKRLPTNAPAYQRHALYYLALFDLGDRLRDSRGIAQLSSLDHLIRCQPDIVLAWQWAILNGAWDLLNRTLISFADYLTLTLQFEETTRLLTLLLTHLPPFEERTKIQNQLAGRAAIYLGVFCRKQPYAISWLQRALLWLEAGEDAWDITASCIFYAESVLGYGVEWDAAEALLARASALIEAHHFHTLGVYVNIALGHLYLYQGKWSELKSVQAGFINNLKTVTFGTLSYSLLMVALLDDWDALSRLVEMGERAFSGQAAEPRAKVWTSHYRDYIWAQQGKLPEAIASRSSSVSAYALYREAFLLPMVHGELAIWELESGNMVAALTSAEEALSYARKGMDQIASCFGLLFVGVVRLFSGDKAAAEPLLREVFLQGQELRHPIITFSALYYLAQIHAHKLPPERLQYISKVGATAPVMHFVLRPLARAHLRIQRFAILHDEQEQLWLTDAATVDRLAGELKSLIAEP